MYLTHNECKSVVSNTFIRTLKDKIFKKRQLIIVTLIWINKSVDECNNSYYCPISKDPIHADYYILTEEFKTRQTLQLLTLKLVITTYNCYYLLSLCKT